MIRIDRKSRGTLSARGSVNYFLWHIVHSIAVGGFECGESLLDFHMTADAG